MVMPGISVEEIIKNMNRNSLRKLLGEKLYGTLAQLSLDEVDVNDLRNVAQVLYCNNNPRAIKDEKLRHQLIDALPFSKAEELGALLKLNARDNIYEKLKHIKFSDRQDIESLFLNFFGIVTEKTAKQIAKPSISQISPMYGLFDYQREVALNTLSILENFPNKALLHMPTGGGKTRTAMHIIARHMQKYGPTLVCWLANSAELLEQAADDFEKSWAVLGDRPLNIYRFWGEHSLDLCDCQNGILIAGFLKMYFAYQRDQNLLMILGDRASLTIVDEAHQAIAPTYRSVIEGLYTKKPKNALLGLSATPGRTWADIQEDEKLSDFFGNQKITISVEDYDDPVSFLISEGYLAQPIFKRINCSSSYNLSKDEKQNLKSADDFTKEVIERVAEDQDRNYQIIIGIEELLTRHKRIIVFGASVEHANMIAGVLVSRGWDAQVITAETPSARRDRIIQRYKSDTANPMILCNYGVLTTGFDAPRTSAAMIARPTKSLVLFSQMVGRAIRGPRAGGNKTAEIITVIDTSLSGFGSVEEAFHNWEDVWNEKS